MKVSASCKITLLGDAAVGKTALRNRFMGNSFSSRYMVTMGADVSSKIVDIGKEKIKFQIWDLAGEARFDMVRGMYCKGATGGILVFDVTRRESYENVVSWVKELWNNNDIGRVPMIVLGNKIDLRDKFPKGVASEDGQELTRALSEACSDIGITVNYLETSAKTGENVDQAFSLLGKSIMRFAVGERKEKE